eukprot:gene3366-13398_t
MEKIDVHGRKQKIMRVHGVDFEEDSWSNSLIEVKGHGHAIFASSSKAYEAREGNDPASGPNNTNKTNPKPCGECRYKPQDADLPQDGFVRCLGYVGSNMMELSSAAQILQKMPDPESPSGWLLKAVASPGKHPDGTPSHLSTLVMGPDIIIRGDEVPVNQAQEDAVRRLRPGLDTILTPPNCLGTTTHPYRDLHINCNRHPPAPTTHQEDAEDAVRRLRPGLDTIYGPPGTGKSTTIYHIVASRVKKGNKALVTCTRNQAVNAVVEKVNGFGCVVFGNPKRLGIDSLRYTLDALVERDPIVCWWKGMARLLRKAEVQLMCNDMSMYGTCMQRLAGIEADIERKPLAKRKACGKWILALQATIKAVRWARLSACEQQRVTLWRSLLSSAHAHFSKNTTRVENIRRVWILNNSRVFLCTVEATARMAKDIIKAFADLKSNKEEGGQRSGSLLRTVPEKKRKKEQGTISLLERCVDAGMVPWFLAIQYRMHPRLSDLVSRLFYENRLMSAPPAQLPRPHPRPCLWVESHGAETRHLGGGFSNPKEVIAVAEQAKLVVASGRYPLSFVISFYNKQKEALQERFKAIPILEGFVGHKAVFKDSGGKLWKQIADHFDPNLSPACPTGSPLGPGSGPGPNSTPQSQRQTGSRGERAMAKATVKAKAKVIIRVGGTATRGRFSTAGPGPASTSHSPSKKGPWYILKMQKRLASAGASTGGGGPSTAGPGPAPSSHPFSKKASGLMQKRLASAGASTGGGRPSTAGPGPTSSMQSKSNIVSSSTRKKPTSAATTTAGGRPNTAGPGPASLQPSQSNKGSSSHKKKPTSGATTTAGGRPNTTGPGPASSTQAQSGTGTSSKKKKIQIGRACTAGPGPASFTAGTAQSKTEPSSKMKKKLNKQGSPCTAGPGPASSQAKKKKYPWVLGPQRPQGPQGPQGYRTSSGGPGGPWALGVSMDLKPSGLWGRWVVGPQRPQGCRSFSEGPGVSGDLMPLAPGDPGFYWGIIRVSKDTQAYISGPNATELRAVQGMMKELAA